MKRFLLLFLLSVAAMCAEVAELNLGSRGRLTLYFAEGWTVNTTEMGGQVTLTTEPPEGVNARCSMTVTFPEQDLFRNKSRLKMQVEADAMSGLATGAVEGKAAAKEFSVSSGFGFYCNFIDPNLRGKPPIKDDFKVVSIGKIRLAPDVMIDVQIYADSFTDRPYQELLGALEGMEYRR